MKNTLTYGLLAALLCCAIQGDAEGRGFGGFRAGGVSYGGGGARSFSGPSSSSFSGARGSYAGSSSFSGNSGWRGAGATSSYDRSWTGAHGGSVSAEGTRGAAVGPYGGFAAGGTRDVTATGAEGRTYSTSKQGGVAVGPYGRAVGGSQGFATASGPRGAAAGGWQSAFAGTRFPTDLGLGHYSNFNTTAVAGHSTSYWSHDYVNMHAGNIRTNFGYYNAFRPSWYTAHPGAWYAAGWTAGAAWRAATWSTLASFVSIPSAPVDYDYGNTVVYNNNNVYVDGDNVGAADTYGNQAVALADQGQQAQVPPTQEWKALGVFALVQGDEKTSNNIFQLAVDPNGVIRGNYYDGLMDTTTPVYGMVDKKTQRAAWTIGKKKDRVFDAGIFNLTKDETPVLVHIGTQQTQQWLLVRTEQPDSAK